jgi:hypothetical protein
VAAQSDKFGGDRRGLLKLDANKQR